MKFPAYACLFALTCTVPTSAISQQTTPAPATPPAEGAQPSAPPPPGTLLDGTPIKLKLMQTLTSADAKTGDHAAFEVIEDVKVDGVIVIAKGGSAIATVTDAEHKKSMGRAGKLDVNIDSVRLIDNEKAALRAVKDAKGGGHVGAMTGAMVATAIVFFPAAPLFLFIHGKDITIPQGTEITAFVEGDMHLDLNKFTPAAAAPPTATAAATAPAEPSVAIEANVPNCDITVDGNFMGNTPSTISLAAGQHEITISKKGYVPWTRKMVVSGSVHVNAELDQTSAK